MSVGPGWGGVSKLPSYKKPVAFQRGKKGGGEGENEGRKEKGRERIWEGGRQEEKEEKERDKKEAGVGSTGNFSSYT